jgi:hypothetical protein
MASDNSVYKPCAALTATVTLLLRFKHKNRSKKQPHIGSFKPLCSPDQSAALNSLYGVLMSASPPKLIDIQTAFHTLCSTLLKSDSSQEHIMAFPTDQALFIWGLGQGKEAYSHPAEIYAKCGALQAAFQLILVQMARLYESHAKTYSTWEGSNVTGEAPELGNIDNLLEEDEKGMEEYIFDLFDSDEEGESKLVTSSKSCYSIVFFSSCRFCPNYDQ